jgi:hypothetical protein
LPDPKRCNLHLAIARISYACGAAEIFDQMKMNCRFLSISVVRRSARTYSSLRPHDCRTFHNGLTPSTAPGLSGTSQILHHRRSSLGLIHGCKPPKSSCFQRTSRYSWQSCDSVTLTWPCNTNCCVKAYATSVALESFTFRINA